MMPSFNFDHFFLSFHDKFSRLTENSPKITLVCTYNILHCTTLCLHRMTVIWCRWWCWHKQKKWTRKLFHVENANLIGDAVISHHLVLPFIFFGITFKHDIYLQTILESSLRKCEQWLVWKGHRWFVRPSWQGRRNQEGQEGQEGHWPPSPFFGHDRNEIFTL